MRKILTIVIMLIVSVIVTFAQKQTINDRILQIIDTEKAGYNDIYKDLHQHPELSDMELRSSEKMAENLASMGFEVTKGIGGYGVVGVFRNGKGKTVMLRTDMDALPVKEATGLPYASQVIMKDAMGNEVPVMHACGHDMHMTMWLGILKTLVITKDTWKGSILAVAQPAEEGSGGAVRMIRDGLFKRFPEPDQAFAYHVSPELPAGTIGYYPGPIAAGVRSVDMTVYGSGGHGALPHTTIDPVVLAARIIMDIQTIVSREINPVKPAVVTVGSIHGGTRSNIIADEVKLQITVRYFEDEVFEHIKEAIIRISGGAAISAGLPEEKMPLVKFSDQDDPPVSNDPGLVMNTVSSMRSILGQDKVIQVDPATIAEDFGKYGRTEQKIPIALFWVGAVNQVRYNDHIQNGTPLIPIHNSQFAPDFEPTFSGGVAAMSKAVIDILAK